MLPELTTPTLVQDARGLERLIADLAGEGEIALDTEADSFFSYREKVCLVQVTAGSRDWLIDPLAGVDLAPLASVLADPARTKVFHDGEYDILILKRAFHFEFAGLFDTRVAASALGDPNPGLASVLRASFGLELDKSLQRSDWSARPLSERQIRYAQLDTHYLIGLMHRQKEELARRGRLPVVVGECRRLELLVPGDAAFDPDEFVRIKGVRTLDRQGQQNLRELFVLRDALAHAADVPPFKVLSTQALIELARHAPRTVQELSLVAGVPARSARRHGGEILAALGRARSLGPLARLPSATRGEEQELDELELELHDRLKQWRKERARREGFDAALVLNRHLLLRLAREKPGDLAALARVGGLVAWQLELFGEELAGVIRSSLEEFQRDGVPRSHRRGWGRNRR